MVRVKSLVLIVTLTFAFSNVSLSQGGVEHMNELGAAFADLKKDTWKYLRTITKGKSARKSEKKREKLLEEYRTQIALVESIEPYNGDATLKDATLKYLELSNTVLREDYDKIVDMEAVAEESYDAMEAYILANKRANKKLTAAGDELEEAEQAFAEKNNITLLEAEQDRKSEKISNAADMLDYYNEVYLIFFKVYKQEAYVLAAQQSNDITAFEQNVNALKMEAEMALKKLDTMRRYEGSGALIMAARKAMEFYKDEAENEFPKVSDFYIKKDNFEKAKEIMDSKKKKDRTQEDVDKYNAAVKEYNKAAGSINETNEEMNDSRNDMLDQWNKSVEDFFKVHS
tara:strand:+ start:21435 stop:22463 length:1029 start_codon:yes stop_codon:yes gene_type:complete